MKRGSHRRAEGRERHWQPAPVAALTWRRHAVAPVSLSTEGFLAVLGVHASTEEAVERAGEPRSSALRLLVRIRPEDVGITSENVGTLSQPHPTSSNLIQSHPTSSNLIHQERKTPRMISSARMWHWRPCTVKLTHEQRGWLR